MRAQVHCWRVRIRRDCCKVRDACCGPIEEPSGFIHADSVECALTSFDDDAALQTARSIFRQVIAIGRLCGRP